LTDENIDRFWGESSPYADLTTENLQLLTLKQAIADFTYFAKTVALPFDKNGSSNADKAPWVFSGGSYSGALAAWVCTFREHSSRNSNASRALISFFE
jgi:hypothetical protein